MLLVKNVSIEEVVGDWTLKSKDFEISALRIHYSMVWRKIQIFLSKHDFYGRFLFVKLLKKIVKTPRWTISSAAPWTWLVWTSTLLRAVIKIQKFTAQGTKFFVRMTQLGSLFSFVKNMYVSRRFWPSSLWFSQGLEIEIGISSGIKATSVSQKSPQ